MTSEEVKLMPLVTLWVLTFNLPYKLQFIVQVCLSMTGKFSTICRQLIKLYQSPQKALQVCWRSVHIDFCSRLSGRQQVLRLQLCPLRPTLRPSSSDCCHVSPYGSLSLLCGVPHATIPSLPPSLLQEVVALDLSSSFSSCPPYP